MQVTRRSSTVSCTRQQSSSSQPIRGKSNALSQSTALTGDGSARHGLMGSAAYRWLMEAAASSESFGSDTMELQDRYQVRASPLDLVSCAQSMSTQQYRWHDSKFPRPM